MPVGSESILPPVVVLPILTHRTTLDASTRPWVQTHESTSSRGNSQRVGERPLSLYSIVPRLTGPLDLLCLPESREVLRRTNATSSLLNAVRWV
jgi:hypothetical protein